MFCFTKWGIFGGMENAKKYSRTIKIKEYDTVLHEFKRNCDKDGTNMTAQIRRMIREFNLNKRTNTRY